MADSKSQPEALNHETQDEVVSVPVLAAKEEVNCEATIVPYAILPFLIAGN